MSADKNHEQQATNIIVNSAKLEQITPNSGPNAGKLTDVLTIRGFHPIFRFNKETQEYESEKPEEYTVKMYGTKAKNVAAHIKEGMALEVRGAVAEKSFIGRESGKEHHYKELVASAVALNLAQSGIRSLEFVKSEKKQKAEPQTIR